MVSRQSYTLQEFVKDFDLPRTVVVCEGSSAIDVSSSDILTVNRVHSMICLSALTTIENHVVDIPLNCPIKLEIPHPNYTYQQLPTADSLRRYMPSVKYVRIMQRYGNMVEAGEILELLLFDEEKQAVVTMNKEGVEICLALSCNAGFFLLLCKEEYSLKNLVDKNMLPRLVRFVQPIPWHVRGNFIENNHSARLREIYLNEHITQHLGVEMTLVNGDIPHFIWMPFRNTEITVSPLPASNVPKSGQTSPKPVTPRRTSSERNQSSSRPIHPSSYVSGQTSFNPPETRTKPAEASTDESGYVVPRRSLDRVHPRFNPDKPSSKPDEAGFKPNPKAGQSSQSSAKQANCRIDEKFLHDDYVPMKGFVCQNKSCSDAVSRNPKDDLPPVPRFSYQPDPTRDIPNKEDLYEEIQPRSPIGGSTYHNNCDKDLSSLSVTQIQKLLKQLNLDCYCEKFLVELVDGFQFVRLDEEALLQHFGFTQFDALTLMTFIHKGYRPNNMVV